MQAAAAAAEKGGKPLWHMMSVRSRGAAVAGWSWHAMPWYCAVGIGEAMHTSY